MNEHNHYDEYLKSGIDLYDTNQLVVDLWLFLTDKPLWQQATIKKRELMHDVKALINAIREHERNNTLMGLSVMSPEQFREFLDKKFDRDK